MSAQLPEDARKPAPDENGGDASALIGALRDATTAGRPREATALAGAVAMIADRRWARRRYAWLKRHGLR